MKGTREGRTRISWVTSRICLLQDKWLSANRNSITAARVVPAVPSYFPAVGVPLVASCGRFGGWTQLATLGSTRAAGINVNSAKLGFCRRVGVGAITGKLSPMKRTVSWASRRSSATKTFSSSARRLVDELMTWVLTIGPGRPCSSCSRYQAAIGKNWEFADICVSGQ